MRWRYQTNRDKDGVSKEEYSRTFNCGNCLQDISIVVLKGVKISDIISEIKCLFCGCCQS